MKKKNKKTSNTISIFGVAISSHNFFALVLCLVIGTIMISRTIYIHQKLSANTITVQAEVVNIYRKNHGQRLWGFEMKYKYVFRGNEFIKNTAIQKNEIDKIHIGDCIEIIISLDDYEVQKWNKSIGSFKCQ